MDGTTSSRTGGITLERETQISQFGQEAEEIAAVTQKSASERRSEQKRVEGERRAGDTARIRERLLAKGRVCLRVRGSSMLPWVRPGDVAIIRRGSADVARCGDMVLFQRDSRLFVHRLIEKRGEYPGERFLVKGDAHPQPDGRMGSEEILGRVVRIYRGGRRIDLDSPRQLALGVLISRISARLPIWYVLTRAAANVSYPARRILQALRPAAASGR